MTPTPNTPMPRTWADRLASLAIGVAATAIAGLVLVQGWQVIARYVLNDSPSWTEPVTLLLLATAMSLAAAAGVHERRHFGFPLLADAFGPRGRRALDVFARLIMAGIGLVMAGWSAILLSDGWDVRMAGAPVPQSLSYLPLGIGGLLIAVFAIVGLRGTRDVEEAA